MMIPVSTTHYAEHSLTWQKRSHRTRDRESAAFFQCCETPPQV
jgi:hypothetical protein